MRENSFNITLEYDSENGLLSIINNLTYDVASMFLIQKEEDMLLAIKDYLESLKGEWFEVKFEYIMLTDKGEPYYTDLIYFNEDVSRDEVLDVLEKVKENDEYTNEDIYKALEDIGGGIKEMRFLGYHDYRNYFEY